MKPQRLSKKLNPLGEIMNLPEAFDQLKKNKHDTSFENLGDWLDQNTSKPRKMKTLYKIAASLTLTALIFIACSIPVQQEEEIGYMIKGLTIEEETKQKINFGEFGLDPSQISIQRVIQQISGDKGSPVPLKEVVMILPEANFTLADQRKKTLSKIFDFQTLNILPIEETVKRTLFESALHTFNLKVKDEITDEKVTTRINKFLQENSNAKSEAVIKRDKDGDRYVVLEVNMDRNSAVEDKRSLESLYNDLAPKDIGEKNNIMSQKEETKKAKKIIKQRKN